MNNFAVWFDIPVKNLDRAMKFYSKVMSVELKAMEIGPSKQANFPFVPGVASGSLRESKKVSQVLRARWFTSMVGKIYLHRWRVSKLRVEQLSKIKPVSARMALWQFSRTLKAIMLHFIAGNEWRLVKEAEYE